MLQIVTEKLAGDHKSFDGPAKDVSSGRLILNDEQLKSLHNSGLTGKEHLNRFIGKEKAGFVLDRPVLARSRHNF